MKKRTISKSRLFQIVCGLLFLASLAGCSSGPGRSRELSEAGKEGKRKADAADEDREDLIYMEKMEIEDINSRNAVYEIYMPKGSEVTDGYAFYSGHGLYYSGDVRDYGDSYSGYDCFKDTYEARLEHFYEPDADYIDISSSGVLENGEDRYYILLGRGTDNSGTAFEIRELNYLEMQPSGAGIFWSLEVYETDVDEKTNLIIDEMADFYGISLEQIKPESRWTGDENQDDYQVKTGHKTLEDLEGYQYLGLASLTDYYEETKCQVMVPKARNTNVGDTHAYSYLHGVQISADVEEIYSGSAMRIEMKSSADNRYESVAGNTERIQNVWRSAMMPVPGFEDALQTVITYEKKGYESEEYLPRVEAYCYIRIDDTYYLAVEVYLSCEKQDASTIAVIRELETAYGIDLLKYYDKGQEEGADGREQESEGVQEENEPVTMAKLMGNGREREEEEPLPDTVLWFNATYAPLTYSNGWNWRLVGGQKPTEENKEITGWGLNASWNVNDRESALETAKWLREEGHRQVCRECMDELESLGLLELKEKEFKKKFLMSELEDKSYRYVLVYDMHQSGKGEDVMAAWDLCRANQLYASFYICGYMTYEEAMDASLENSLVLQKMYSSWEEMIEGYMLGYQFWQGDPGIKEDSPTKERYRYYEMLCESDDNPYILDWNMELKKSW